MPIVGIAAAPGPFGLVMTMAAMHPMIDSAMAHVVGRKADQKES
jgi:hypothetical protein